MTLVVGVRCTNGIVLAADGAAHHGVVRPTVRSAFKKIRIVGGVAAVAVAGTTSILQQYEDVLDTLVRENAFVELRPVSAMNVLRNRLMEQMQAQFNVSHIAAAIDKEALASCTADLLAVLFVDGKARLFHFDKYLAPEEIRDEIPFIAIGTGHVTADPFLAYLRRIYCDGKCPSLPLGTMTATYTLKHAIETGAHDVAGKPQIVTFDETGVVVELTEDQINTHYEFIGHTEHDMRRMHDMMAFGAPDVRLPAPPEAESA